MANYSTLISQINAYVKQNGNKLITGQGLQTILDAMVVSLGNGFQFIGVATIDTEPGTPDQNVFYLAFGPGTFTHFGGEELLDGEVALFFYTGSWSAVKLDLATKTAVQALAEDLNTLAAAVQDKVDKVPGKGLSTNDFTNEMKALVQSALQSDIIKQALGSDAGAVISQAAITQILGDYALKDGYYQTLIAGAAENLVGDAIPVTSGYTDKPLALGSNGEINEVADGRVAMSEVIGRAMAWNQLVPISPTSTSGSSNEVTFTDNRDGSYTVNGTATDDIRYILTNVGLKYYAGHKYLLKGCPSGGGQDKYRMWFNTGFLADYGQGVIQEIPLSGSAYIEVRISSGQSFTNAKFVPICFDLTVMFGPGKEPATVEQAEAMIAARRRMKPYFPPNEGTLLGARMLGWSMPMTANLLNPTTGKARLVAYNNPGNTNSQYTVIGLEGLTGATLTFTPDATGVAETITPDASNHFTISGDGELQIEASAGNLTQVCVLMTWDGSQDENMVAYENHETNPDSANIYYDDNGTMKQVFENGIIKAASDTVADKLYFDKFSKKWGAYLPVGSVDLGTLSWNVSGKADNLFTCYIGATYPGYIRVMCGKYVSVYGVIANMNNHEISGYGSNLYIKDTAFSDAATFKTAMNGVLLWYELASPVTLTDLYYKVGNDYVPMEQVFPDGFIGYGCNWATETLVQQADDANGQPTSITPETTETFNSDLREALKTLIDAQEDNVDLANYRSNMVAMCNALQSAGIIAGYTISDQPTGGVYAFTFTPNS